MVNDDECFVAWVMVCHFTLCRFISWLVSAAVLINKGSGGLMVEALGY